VTRGTPAPHLDDGRMSALVDGAGGAEDAAHVAGCAACAARLSAWQAAASAVGTPVRPPRGARDAAIAAALGELDLPAVAEHSRPARQSRPWRPAVRLAAVAAAVLLIGGASYGLLHGTSGSHGATHSQAVRAAGSAGTAAAGSSTGTASVGSSEGTAGAGATAGALYPGVPTFAALRDYDTIGSLAAPLRAALVSGRAVPAPLRPAFSACVSSARTAARLQSSPTAAVEATLTFGGRPALVYVWPLGSGDEAVVVARPGCAYLAQGHL
jgi:hypothetical protein